jgi:hypothetical protein
MHDLISRFFSAQKNFIHLVYHDSQILNNNAFQTFQNCKFSELLELEKEFIINDKVYQVYKIKNTLFRFLTVYLDNQLFELYIMI